MENMTKKEIEEDEHYAGSFRQDGARAKEADFHSSDPIFRKDWLKYEITHDVSERAFEVLYLKCEVEMRGNRLAFSVTVHFVIARLIQEAYLQLYN